MDRFVLKILCIFVFSSLISCYQEKVYTIAVVGDISKANSNLGEQLKYAAEYLKKKFLQERKNIKIIFKDDQSNPVIARDLALELVSSSNVVAVVGHSTSQTTQAAHEIYKNFGLPLLAPIATFSDLTKGEKGKENNAFRLVPSNKQQSELIADTVERIYKKKQKLEKKRVATLIYYEPTEYGQDLSALIESSIWNKGIVVRRKKKLSLNEKGNLRTEPARADLRDFQDIGILIFAGYYKQAQDLVREISGVRSDISIILTDGAKDRKLFSRLGSGNVETFLAFIAPDWQHDRTPYTNVQKNNIEDFLHEMEYEYENNNDKNLGYSPIAVDAIYLITEIIQAHDHKLSPKEMRRKIIKAMKTKKQKGLFRDYQFTKNGEVKGGQAFLYKVERKGPPNFGVFRQITLDEIDMKGI